MVTLTSIAHPHAVASRQASFAPTEPQRPVQPGGHSLHPRRKWVVDPVTLLVVLRLTDVQTAKTGPSHHC